jgi:hypothetical protein
MEKTCLNLVKEYFDAFIKCMNCQKEDTNKETELAESQLNSNAETELAESRLNSNVETELTESQLNSNASNLETELTESQLNSNAANLDENNHELSTKTDENISIKIDGNNSGYFIKDIDKKEEDDNFEIVSWCVHEESAIGR